jgi:hypothetical protein
VIFSSPFGNDAIGHRMRSRPTLQILSGPSFICRPLQWAQYSTATDSIVKLHKKHDNVLMNKLHSVYSVFIYLKHYISLQLSAYLGLLQETSENYERKFLYVTIRAFLNLGVQYKI